MPELPEVETVKNDLEPHLLGRRIEGVSLFWEKMVRQPSAEEFRSRLAGRRVTALSRRGKYLVIGLDSGESLVIHLKMSGALLLGGDVAEPPPYTRAAIHLEGGGSVFFRDPRKFGVMYLLADSASVTGKLGPEPLEEGFTPQLLARLLQGRKAPVKAVLVDQNIIAGIGNMYADEALFAARIHPARSAESLTTGEVKRLHGAIQRVLRAGIGSGGASIVNYLRPGGRPGTAHDHFRVAHRRGQPCARCGTPVQRIRIRQRGSYFCPRCQPAP